MSRAAERGDDRHWPSAPTALSIVDFGAAGELFKLMVGIDLTHVPYRGEALALTDLLGGQVQILFGTLPTSIEYIRTGKLRALAVTTATRSHALPDVPTVSDFLPGYEASSWWGGTLCRACAARRDAEAAPQRKSALQLK